MAWHNVKCQSNWTHSHSALAQPSSNDANNFGTMSPCDCVDLYSTWQHISKQVSGVVTLPDTHHLCHALVTPPSKLHHHQPASSVLFYNTVALLPTLTFGIVHPQTILRYLLHISLWLPVRSMPSGHQIYQWGLNESQWYTCSLLTTYYKLYYTSTCTYHTITTSAEM